MPSELSVLSWNMLFSNKNQEDAFAFIESSSADVICLQEVPIEFLERLRTLPFHLTHAIDTRWETDPLHPERGDTTTLLVILSRYPYVSSDRISLPPLAKQVLIRTRLFHLGLRIFGIWKGGRVYEREAQFADINVGTQVIRVINTHLPLRTPEVRRKEFEVLRSHHSGEAIDFMCGDFNILEHPYIKVWNYFQGGSLGSAMPWSNERGTMEVLFKDAGLKNPLRGQCTHPISRSQLDHILVPPAMEVISAVVNKNAHGSDHRPIEVSVRL